MKKWLALISVLIPLGLASVSGPAAPSGPQFATGYVFQDSNGNQKLDAGEKTLARVRVSNGREIVTTDKHGQYRLPVTDDTTLFVIKPRGWRTPIDDHMLPRFYYIHKPDGSPASKYPGVKPTGPLPDSVDFPLYPQREPDTFKALLFGDPQPRDQKEID
ncbi:MAG TPA: metallophosphoesterase, partial [Planctomycetaceae bacterium]|nr:metallophosphoesterase [Planctomycetaceae bacterium]